MVSDSSGHLRYCNLKSFETTDDIFPNVAVKQLIPQWQIISNVYFLECEYGHTNFDMHIHTHLVSSQSCIVASRRVKVQSVQSLNRVLRNLKRPSS